MREKRGKRGVGEEERVGEKEEIWK